MDNRKFQSGAALNPPSVPASPSLGYPTNGNVSVAPTVPGEWWFHQIGEELRNVITAAGLSPTHNLVNQLLAALNAGWGMPKNISTNGYATLPGGFIVQWGTVAISSTGVVTFTNPLAWPNGIKAGIACEAGANSWGSSFASIFGLSLPQATLTTTTIYTRTVSAGAVSPNAATAVYIMVGN